jgi:hypothetical protein
MFVEKMKKKFLLFFSIGVMFESGGMLKKLEVFCTE